MLKGIGEDASMENPWLKFAGYGNLFRTNSPQNVSLSRRNLDGYARLVGELGAARMKG